MWFDIPVLVYIQHYINCSELAVKKSSTIWAFFRSFPSFVCGHGLHKYEKKENEILLWYLSTNNVYCPKGIPYMVVQLYCCIRKVSQPPSWGVWSKVACFTATVDWSLSYMCLMWLSFYDSCDLLGSFMLEEFCRSWEQWHLLTKWFQGQLHGSSLHNTSWAWHQAGHVVGSFMMVWLDSSQKFQNVTYLDATENRKEISEPHVGGSVIEMTPVEVFYCFLPDNQHTHQNVDVEVTPGKYSVGHKVVKGVLVLPCIKVGTGKQLYSSYLPFRLLWWEFKLSLFKGTPWIQQWLTVTMTINAWLLTCYEWIKLQRLSATTTT